jgi:hypothetical protein
LNNKIHLNLMGFSLHAFNIKKNYIRNLLILLNFIYQEKCDPPSGQQVLRNRLLIMNIQNIMRKYYIIIKLVKYKTYIVHHDIGFIFSCSLDIKKYKFHIYIIKIFNTHTHCWGTNFEVQMIWPKLYKKLERGYKCMW